MSDTLTSSPLKIRQEFLEVVLRDLLDPAGGAEEIITEQTVRGRATFPSAICMRSTYNRLQELHVEMDRAVASAYGWGDLDLGHGFHETAQGVRFTVNESARREVLSQLLKLNHERWEEEQKAGLHEKKGMKNGGKKSTRKEKPKSNEGQMGLL